ncbi:MAG TPA: methionine--tRNA ligase [Acidimicrobiales bacterium]
MPTTYVTVAIPYVNAAPHLGYAYELVQADIYARARRLAGDRVRFLGGTDDHSLKNVLAAEAAGVPTRDFVDDHAARFAALAQPLGLSFDDFIRTSADPRHAPAVQRLWRACAERGDLYEHAYQGQYCVGCEQFYGPGELERGRCPEHGSPTERIAERNWFFRLSSYQDHVERLISSGELAVRPRPFAEEVLAFVRRGLDDISVSRSVGRARGWGIRVPGDATQVVSVWFDALTNYLSALGFGDPGSDDHRRWWLDADHRVHVIGKGILRFHAVYWPAFLASAGQPAPTRIQVHPYLTVEGRKLSKSGAHAAGPAEIVGRYGTDPLRWWFARDVGALADTDFSAERLVARADEDLANALGNVVNRIATLVHRTRGGRVPEPSPAAGGAPLAAVRGLEQEVADAIADFDLRGATRRIVDAVATLNRDLEATRPWEVARAGDDGDRGRQGELDALLARHVATARRIARAARPIVPDLAARLAHQLGGDGRDLPTPIPAVARLAPG